MKYRAPKHHQIDKRAPSLLVQIKVGNPNDEFDYEQLAELTGLSIYFFRHGRYKGWGPHLFPASDGKYKATRSALTAWLQERARHWYLRELQQ